MNLPPFLKARKFWALIVGAVVIVLRSYVPNFPLTDEQLTDIGLLIVAYIIGSGLQDMGKPSTVDEQLASMRLQLGAMSRQLLVLRAERDKAALRN